MFKGYVRFDTLYLDDDTVFLTVTEVEGKDLGVEGGNDFHSSSAFVPVHTRY